MNSTTLRTIIAIVLFVHAIGHGQGVFSALGMFNTESWNARSWLLDDLLGEKVSQTVALIIWLICLVGFLVTAFSFLDILVPHSWWRAAALIFAVPSFLGLVLYWNSFAMIFNKVGALGVNGAILIGLAFLNWPTEADIGF